MRKTNIVSPETALIKPEQPMTTRRKKRFKIFPYAMVSIAVIHFIVFWIYVNADQFILAFTVPTADGKQLFSFNNFKDLFADFGYADSVLSESLINTFKYWFMNMVKLFLTVVVAYFIYKKVKGAKFFRFIFYLPCVIPPVVMIMLFRNLISTQGPLSIILDKLFGVEMPPLLQSINTTSNTIIFYTFWSGFGVYLLIFIGAMNRIPDGLIDAGKIDGCGCMREFCSIVIPVIWETLMVSLLLSVSSIMTSTGPIFFFTNGQRSGTYTLSFWIFMQVKEGKSPNFPSAVGLFFTVIALPLAFICQYILSKFNKDVTY